MNEKQQRLLFVLNPHAGKGLIRNKVLDIVDAFAKEGYEIVIHPTQAPEDARKLIMQQGGEFDRIICSGGDGTLDEVISGLMHWENRPIVGYIPSGSTNDFANSLKLSKNTKRATAAAVKGTPFPCDVGQMNEKYFVYVAAFGLFTDVSYATSQEWKNILGHAAYIFEGIKRLSDIPSYHLTVECNGETFEEDFIFGMITNSTSVGGFQNMTGDNVVLDDGLFEVTLIRTPQNLEELSEIVGNLTKLVEDETDLIYTAKTGRIRISGQETVWTLDGEYGGTCDDVLIQNHKQAISIMR